MVKYDGPFGSAWKNLVAAGNQLGLIIERTGRKITVTNNETGIEGEYTSIQEAHADLLSVATPIGWIK